MAARRLAPALFRMADIAATAACIARFGRVDGLVNAAGLTTRGAVVSGVFAVWNQLFAVNARAGFVLMQAETMGRCPDWQAEVARRLPLGRLVTAEQAARLAVFLPGDASQPMSGAIADFEQKVAGAV